jgi:hypothetical protein
MATTTPNYGWTVPTSTDLVKDGATAIETLGDAIDASMNTALGTKKAGLVLLTTATFSGVTSVSAAANTFTSTYANYRIVLDLTSVSSDADMAIRLRASGSDNTTANYFTAVASYTTGNTLSGYTANTGQTAWQIFPTDAGTNNHSYSASIDLCRPQEAQLTTSTLLGNGVTFAGTVATYFGGNLFNATTQFDSITFLNAGNIAGRYSIYGYNN